MILMNARHCREHGHVGRDKRSVPGTTRGTPETDLAVLIPAYGVSHSIQLRTSGWKCTSPSSTPAL